MSEEEIKYLLQPLSNEKELDKILDEDDIDQAIHLFKIDTAISKSTDYQQ